MSKPERDIHSQESSCRLAHSVSEVVKLTGVGRSVLYEQIGEGRLRIRKLGRRTLIFDADLKAWLANLPEKGRGDSKQTKLNTHK
jgi:excisionase family DNA binding protein